MVPFTQIAHCFFFWQLFLFFIKICIVISLVNKFLLSCLILALTMLNYYWGAEELFDQGMYKYLLCKMEN